MINLPTEHELDVLAAQRGQLCVSVYLSSSGVSAASDELRIESKKIIAGVERMLSYVRVDPVTKLAVVGQLRAILPADDAIRPLSNECLAIFASAKLGRQYHIPSISIPYSVGIGWAFDLKPLLRAVRENQSYILLALDHKAVRVYEGDRDHLHSVRLKGLPSDMVTALLIDEYPKARELHDVGPAYLGKGSEGYHSQYNVSQVDKQLLVEFFRSIDRHLHRYLQTKHKPLILGGVRYLQPLYRKINSYKELWPVGVAGSLRRMPLGTIRAKAWAAVIATRAMPESDTVFVGLASTAKKQNVDTQASTLV